MLKRYKKIMSAEYGCRDQMLARHDGQWVRYSDAQAEIARLQGEVERLKLAKLYDEKAKDRALLLEKHAIEDTAHNNAIEAAENLDGIEGYSNCVPRHLIRALKRPAQEQPK